jgi:hypothetical protein
MNAIQTAYINALLADASYVKEIKKGEIRASDFTTRLTQSQADFLAANFKVKDSVETPNTIDPLLGPGFDAVVWEGKTGTPYEGQVYASMRGTQGSTDIADDVSLAAIYGDARDDLIYGGIGDHMIGSAGADGAMQFIAACAHPAGATGRFDAQTRAANDSSWRTAA